VLLKGYRTLQTTALRQILGAFRGSPTKALEIEASILLVELRAEKLCQQYAIRLLTFSKHYLIQQALQQQKQGKPLT